MEREESLQCFEHYLRRRYPDRRTPIDYLSDLRQFAAACPKAWQTVTMQDIDAFVDQQRHHGLSPATIKRRVAALKTFFDFLAEETGDLNWPNPVRFKRHAGKQPRRLPRDLNDEQVERLWAVITPPRDQAWFVLLLRAGLRVGEVVSLTLADLLTPAQANHPARLRVCGKGRKERVVLLSPDAATVLQAWLNTRPPSSHPQLFLNERGVPLTVNGLQWLLRQYATQAGLTVTPHQLRHTYARQLTEAGMPITSLGKLLGHADISTTQLYTAGADPELATAYQQAMQRVSAAALQPTPTVLAAPPAQDAVRLEPTPPPPVKAPPDLPVWETWAPELPEAIRQACLSFIQRRLPNWKPQRQRRNAQKLLSEFQHFWRWQLARRPLQHPADLVLADLQAYQTARATAGKAPATINRTLDPVLALLKELTDQGVSVAPSVFRLRHLPRPDSLPRHLREAEAQQLEAYVQTRRDTPDPRLRLENACFWVLAHTGLRASECIDLEGQDWDRLGGRLWVRQGKGQRDRVVYLSPNARHALDLYCADLPAQPGRPLFSHQVGQPLSYTWVYKHTVALGQAAGVSQVTPHRLRHTLATRLLNAGMGITRIQKLLGHDYLNTTMIYARVLDHTVEADYRQAMQQIERRQMPLSTTPELAFSWPQQIESKLALDSSV